MSLKACSICKQEKLLVEFNKNKSKIDGLQTHCRSCNREKSKNYYSSNKEKHKTETRKRSLQQTIKARQYVFEYFEQHPCVDCGETDPIVLEFDHVKDNKEDAICKMITRGLKLETIKQEIEKCEVRCANCHRRKTAKQFKWYTYMGL